MHATGQEWARCVVAEVYRPNLLQTSETGQHKIGTPERGWTGSQAGLAPSTQTGTDSTLCHGRINTRTSSIPPVKNQWEQWALLRSDTLHPDKSAARLHKLPTVLPTQPSTIILDMTTFLDGLHFGHTGTCQLVSIEIKLAKLDQVSRFQRNMTCTKRVGEQELGCHTWNISNIESINFSCDSCPIEQKHVWESVCSSGW